MTGKFYEAIIQRLKQSEENVINEQEVNQVFNSLFIDNDSSSRDMRELYKEVIELRDTLSRNTRMLDHIKQGVAILLESNAAKLDR